MSTSEFKSGFVGIVGPTNSGKSTLVNTLVGAKVSIVSSKVQTTYHGVKGILTTPHSQIVFVDTPGLQRHSESVARLLNKVAERSAKETDVLVWVFDASLSRCLAQIDKLRTKIAERPAEFNICVLNKVDKVAKLELLPMIAELTQKELFSDVIPMSAKNGDGAKNLLAVIESKLKVGVPFFPEDMITDRTQQFLVSEMVREQIYRATHQEIPYSAWVEIEGWENTGKVPTIRAVIHVDSSSRKGILIGKAGAMLKEIGTKARQEAEQMIGHKICLKLHVDIEEEWKKDPRRLNTYLELV